MNKEEKELLLKDLCGRLPYKVKGRCKWIAPMTKSPENTVKVLDSRVLEAIQSIIDHGLAIINSGSNEITLDKYEFKPYLRPMSSMTEKEYETFPIPYSFDSFSTWNNTILSNVIEGTQILIGIDEITEIIDWLNSHHFDYRGLIEMGLALEAPKEMYNC